MTHDEFNKTAFRKGDEARVAEGRFVIEGVDLTGNSLFYLNGGCTYSPLEIIEYIPVENGIEQIIEKQESEYYKQEQASFWKDVYLTALDQPEIKAADDCTNWADQALEDYKQRFKL